MILALPETRGEVRPTRGDRINGGSQGGRAPRQKSGLCWHIHPVASAARPCTPVPIDKQASIADVPVREAHGAGWSPPRGLAGWPGKGTDYAAQR